MNLVRVLIERGNGLAEGEINHASFVDHKIR